MTDDVIEASHQYVQHANDCHVCSSAGLGLCSEGLRLLHVFYDALTAWKYPDQFDT